MERRAPTARDFVANTRGRGEMIKAPINLQDLRRPIYAEVKAEPSWRIKRRASAESGGVDGVRFGPVESYSGTMSPITLGRKCAGKRSEGNPHYACEAEGAGNGTTASRTEARNSKETATVTGSLTSPRQSSTLPGSGTCRSQPTTLVGFTRRYADSLRRPQQHPLGPAMTLLSVPLRQATERYL